MSLFYTAKIGDNMKTLILTKLFPTDFSINEGIFNQVFLDYFTKQYSDIKCEVIRPIPYGLNFKVEGKKITLHPLKNKRDHYTIYYPRILSFWKYFLNYHHILYYKKINKFIKKNLLEFDIIHAHWLYPDGYVAVKLGEYFKKPVIVHCHGSDIDQLLFDKKLYKLNEYTLNTAHNIIVASNALRDKLLKKYPKIESKVIVVHNSVDISQYNKVSYNESLRRLNLSDENTKIIVFVGHIIPSKGICELLEATNIILRVRRDFKVYLVGTGPHNEEIRFKKYVIRNGLNENVFFVGEYDRDLIKYWFRIAHFSILPSYSEGYPNVLIESLSTGTPVIATNVGGIPEIITNKLRGKLVPPRDSKSLAQAMLEFLDKKEKRAEIIEDIQSFDITHQSQRIYDIYANILSG